MADIKTLNNSTFKLIIFEMIKYIDSKNIQPKEKLSQLEESGMRVGERIVNLILNKLGGKNKLETKDVIMFISNKVWNYIFPKQVSKIHSNSKGGFFFYIDEIYLFTSLVRSREPNKDDMIIFDYILTFLSGVIKGSLQVFEINSLVNGICKYDILYNELSNGYIRNDDGNNVNSGNNNVSGINTSQYPFIFNIMILNNSSN